MSRVSPPGDRATIADTPEGLLVSTPVRKHWFIILFLPVWLVGWVFGEVTVGRELLDFESPQGERVLFLVAWLAMWTLGGLFAFAVLLWSLFGVETVTVAGRSIMIRREVLGIGFRREYDMVHATNLRVAADSFNLFDPRAGLRFWGFGGGPIAFDYGSSTVRFANGLDEAEANRIVARIVSRNSTLRGMTGRGDR